MQPYNLDLINSTFDSRTLERGKKYLQQGRVIAFEVFDQGRVIEATVAGGDIYEVEITYTAAGYLAGRCSCPVFFNCKHAAATALKYYRLCQTQHTEQAQSKSEWQRWLARMPNPSKLMRQSLALETGEFHLLYHLKADDERVLVELEKAYLRKDGNWSQRQRYYPQPPFHSWNLPNFVNELDRMILPLMASSISGPIFSLDGELGTQALRRLLETSRCFYEGKKVTTSKALPLQTTWQENNDDWQLQLVLPDVEEWVAIGVEPPYYLNTQTAEIGEISTNLAASHVQHLQAIPNIPKEAIGQVAVSLRQHFDQEQLALPIEVDMKEVSTFTPCLTAELQAIDNLGNFPVFSVSFFYGEIELQPDYDNEAEELSFHQLGSTQIKVIRDFQIEFDTEILLSTYGLKTTIINDRLMWIAVGGGHPSDLLLSTERFIQEGFKQLEADGWRIHADGIEAFTIEHLAFDFQIQDTEEKSWFDFALNIQTKDGQTLDTASVLELWFAMGTPDILHAPLGEQWVAIDAKPLKHIESLLLSLQGQQLNQPVRLPSYQAAQLSALEALDQREAPITKKMLQNLSNFDGIQEVAVPKMLEAELRDYQQQGLNWLAFLYEYGFGGILADDMGLGKTLQVLSFIAHLKETGQLKHPVLVVAPTSLLGNWQREAERFTPDLSLHIMYGQQRHDEFQQLKQHDIIVTSYNLLLLDSQQYEQQRFSLAVLDEAQAIKNPQAKTSAAVRRLKPDMRLCLSGTPLENHLGELWSLMDFALPGLLYGRRLFNDYYRNPIEKEHDAWAQQQLAQKIAPFILRRNKAQVAKELPEKTVLTQYVELGKKQASLYEGIRVSMEKRIRDLVAKQGMAKSHIEFLDALLKLRQACIAPQLVKLDQAKNITESAKLDWLADNLPDMTQAGRRILLFSQFTQALTLVEKLLKKQKIGYSKLTGATRKRQEAIDAFQNGDVPVFLISLKAGGSGLNLTAADTVIHLDPWWNPAIENQATDRAYRIGQDKPVFVYKLVAENTVEERIQRMQAEKQALADALFSSTGKAAKPENKDDLLALLK